MEQAPHGCTRVCMNLVLFQDTVVQEIRVEAIERWRAAALWSAGRGSHWTAKSSDHAPSSHLKTSIHKMQFSLRFLNTCCVGFYTSRYNGGHFPFLKPFLKFLWNPFHC